MIKGKYEVVSYNTVKITELPIGTWTSSYKAFLEKLMDDKNIKGKKKKSSKILYRYVVLIQTIEFTVRLHMGILPNLVSKKIDDNINHFEKVFGLTYNKIYNKYVFI